MAYVDGELDAEGRESFRSHVEDCDPCRRQLERLRGREAVFSEAAGRLDRPMPEIPHPAEDAARDASPGTSGGRAGRHGELGPIRAAAAAVLVLLFGSLLTPPGRALAERALSRIAGLFGGAAGGGPPAAATSDTVPGQRATAVSVPARDGRLTVAIVSTDPAGGALRVRFGPEARAVVEGIVGDVERGPGELRVRVDDLSGLRVQLPDSVPSAVVRVNGRTVLRQTGREARPAVPADTAAGEILLRTGR